MEVPSETALAGKRDRRERQETYSSLGVLWQPFPQLNLRLDYAIPLVEIRNRGNNLQDKGLYFSINYQL
ncbi:hypothetical protein [Scytonema sp. NUACC26]|uniref:hypothetical protein n=1 Tax=Scytonema sp. NUACC26 TaxID=3140176 RepID=UPI0038B3D31A